MDYLALKHSHLVIVILSIVLFYVRSFSRMGSGSIAKNKIIYIGSHGVDTLLIISGVMLMAMAKMSPLEQYWLLEKLVLVVIYIVVSVVSAKQTSTVPKVVCIAINTVVLLAIGFLASAKATLIM